MIGNHVVTGIVGAVSLSVFSALGACAPVPSAVPTLVPCEGTNLTIHGFDSAPGCDLTPPQVLSVFVEHPAPWSQVEADTFFFECDQSGGTVTDAHGDAWVCEDIDY
jgi:hypothetical protein